MVNGEIRFGLRTRGVLRDQSIHQMQHDFARDNRICINLGDRLRTDVSRIGKPPPVIDVRNRHVIKTTGHTVALAVAHDRHVDHFRHSLVRIRAKWLTLLVFSVSDKSGTGIIPFALRYSKSPQMRLPRNGAEIVSFAS